MNPTAERWRGWTACSASALWGVMGHPDTGTFVGSVPGWPGAHSQGATLDDVEKNLREVNARLLEDGDPKLESELVGLRTIQVRVLSPLLFTQGVSLTVMAREMQASIRRTVVHRTASLGLALVLVIQGSRLSAQVEPEAAASRDVAGFYDGRYRLPWRENITDLSAPDPDARTRAFRYFKALMARLGDDQLAGRAPLRPDPAWGKGAKDIAFEARQEIVAYLASGTPSLGTIDALEWTVEFERVPRIVRAAMDALTVSRDPRSGEILQRIVREDLGGAASVEKALRALMARELIPERASLERCLRAHRRQVREAAVPLAAKAGIPVPPAPEGAAFFETKGGAEILARLARLVGPPLPEKTPWVEIEASGADEETDMREVSVTDRGWLLKAGPDEIEIETPNGYVKRISSSETRSNKIVRHRHRSVDVGGEVERVVALRAKMNLPESRESRSTEVTVEVRTSVSPRDRLDLRGEFSDCGALSSQFEPFAYSLYEVLLGFRVYQLGRRDEAAKLLVPMIEATPDDDDFDYFVQWYLGNALGHRMIARFCEHDLDQTLAIARRIQGDFPRSQFAKLAGRLIEEIPRRSGDWTEFRLPTPEDWKQVSAALERDAQIQYLCARVRLVTCAGAGLGPRDPSWAKQSLEPGRADHRATSVSRGASPVINPLQVLRNGPLSPRADGGGASGADAKDLATLKACAAEDWLCPCVSAWRFFHPGRTVSTSSELLGSFVKEIER